MQVEVIPEEENLEQDGDGQWPFHSLVEQLILDMFDPGKLFVHLEPFFFMNYLDANYIFAVWEVRHGSVMALREILTHHGASAGVLMPDLSPDGALDVDFKDKGFSTAVKREREIDLNMQVPADDSEPNLKKIKFEEAPTKLMDALVSPVKSENFDINMKVEDGCTLPAQQVNGQFDPGSIKLESESNLDGLFCQSNEDVHMVEPKGYCDVKQASFNSDMLKNLPENCELMNWLKLVRHSWQKNCEFLQDCAIRFLCILSLDRYDSDFLLIVAIMWRFFSNSF